MPGFLPEMKTPGDHMDFGLQGSQNVCPTNNQNTQCQSAQKRLLHEMRTLKIARTCASNKLKEKLQLACCPPFQFALQNGKEFKVLTSSCCSASV